MYVTTPIYYVNDHPHLGHLYTSVAADVLGRFYRMAGADVFVLTGTDEHGSKVAQAACKKNMDPKEYVDQLSEVFRRLIVKGNVHIDDFIRTTQQRHKDAAQHLWRTLQANGYIYLDAYEGWYAPRDEAFYGEDELIWDEGKNPEKALAPTGAPVTWISEPCYFFRLSAFRQPLLDYYASHPQAIRPESRYNEVMGFLKGEVRDLAISRTRVSWGIPVPKGDSHGPAHTMYVWLDALTNYIAALGYPNMDAQGCARWNDSLHLVGKDILRFHGVYWPAFLMAAGLPAPKCVFAHGWWTRDGEKMSKSLGNGLDPFALLDLYGADRVRFYLMRHVHFGHDGDFSWASFVQRCNQELANDFSNLAFRVLQFIHTRAIDLADPRLLTFSSEGKFLAQWVPENMALFGRHIEGQNICAYLEGVQKGISAANAYVSHFAPWNVVKDIARAQEEGGEWLELENYLQSGLWSVLFFLRDIALVLAPIIPQAAADLLSQLNQKAALNKGFFAIGTLFEGSASDFLPPEPLFLRIEAPDVDLGALPQ